MKLYLVIDGGTTNLRVTALEASTGRQLAALSKPGGVRNTAIDGNNGRLKTMLAEGIREVLSLTDAAPKEVECCVAFGMITSGMGLLELPHLPAPADLTALHDGMKTEAFPDVAPFPISFIPGVRNFAGPVDEMNCAGMDMMRGEETESVGLYDLLQLEGKAVFVLPGSHNKIVSMGEGGSIQGCMTSVSGELLDAMTHHTILKDAVEGSFCSEETYIQEAACSGAAQCREYGLGRAAFSGRILSTLGGKSAEYVQSWLLGAVLAQDVPAMQAFVPDRNTRILVAGKQPLRRAFIDVLFALEGRAAEPVPDELSGVMGTHGALRIAEGR